MCGIIAYSGNKPVDTDDFKILMLYAAMRGTHSTGIATFDGVVKSNDASPFFIASNPIPKVNTILGHTRNPSANTPKEEEHAHPYVFDNMFGVHNGYFTDWWEVRNRYKIEGDMTDSYPILYAISQDGFEKVATELSDRSTFALSWLSKEDNMLYLYRSTKELHYGQKDEQIYISSDAQPLEAIEATGIKLVPNETLIGLKDGVIKVNKKVDLKKDLYSSTYGYRYGHGYARRSYGDQKSPKEIAKERDKKQETTDKTEKNIPIIDSHNAPHGCDYTWFKGNKVYYWKDGDYVYVEEIHSFKDSQLFDYNIQNDTELANLGRHYLPVLDAINNKLNAELEHK